MNVVRGENTKTKVPFFAPPSFTLIHRPNFGSCPIPATNKKGATERAFGWCINASPDSSSLAHVVSSIKPLATVRSCNEFITPGAGTLPTRLKCLSFGSSFHIRMSPSHEPFLTDGLSMMNDVVKGWKTHLIRKCQSIAKRKEP